MDGGGKLLEERDNLFRARMHTVELLGCVTVDEWMDKMIIGWKG